MTIRIVDLKTEYASNPLGLDERKPRLFWRIEAAERGALQSADAAQSGLGNHSCGYAPTLEKYLVRPTAGMSMGFLLRPGSCRE